MRAPLDVVAAAAAVVVAIRGGGGGKIGPMCLVGSLSTKRGVSVSLSLSLLQQRGREKSHFCKERVTTTATAAGEEGKKEGAPELSY